jgi:hypothetical protein
MLSALAAQLAEAMAHTHGYMAALAFARSGSQAAGQYGAAKVFKLAQGKKMRPGVLPDAEPHSWIV